MKQLIALIAFVLISGCDLSTDSYELTLPPVTTEGKNILACKINGDIYISNGYRSLGMLASGDGVEVNDDFQNNLYDIFSIRTWPQLGGNENSEIQMYIPKSAAVNDTVPVAYKYQGSYSGYVLGNSAYDEYHSSDYYRGKVIILRNDDKAISGTFEFQAYSPATEKIIHVTEGRFDIEKRN